MGCKPRNWQRILSAPAEHLRIKSDNTRFPHVTAMRDPCIDRLPDGTLVPGTKPVIAKSRTHMEKLMEDRGYTYYVGGDQQEKQGQMPAHIKRMEEHPQIRRYLDLKKAGRIPEPMMLNDEQLKERFHV
tara:strand:+ start:127 stop:513 length:387 start_codon:yes stop_codon:yes gene_type:complete